MYFFYSLQDVADLGGPTHPEDLQRSTLDQFAFDNSEGGRFWLHQCGVLTH